ncbi:hypothetical protein DER45DRAFT_576874 [Fusarium avenaceum]|nr:hypothetical protein DER45DRAFT_576874 [Fusarium avenaceum]
MFSSSIFTGALALLAINGVNAGPCRPSSVLTTETSAAITSVVTESSIATIHDTTTMVPLTADLSSTTIGATTTSEDVLTSETATVDTTTVLLITTTTQNTQDTTATLPATTTTTAAAGPECHVDIDCSVSGQECNNGVCETPGGNQDSCADNTDCLLSVNPLCARGLCECQDAQCTVSSVVDTCTTDSQCSAGATCQEGVCFDETACNSESDCIANNDLCSSFRTCACVNGVCSLSSF